MSGRCSIQMQRRERLFVDLWVLYGLCLLLKAVFQRYWCDMSVISSIHLVCRDSFHAASTHRLACDVRVGRYGSVYTR